MDYRAENPARWWIFAAIFAVVLLTRLPFLDAGYGMHADGWRVARVARQMAQGGPYEVSRFPGNPVQEIVCSWFWNGRPWMLNLLSAVMSALAAGMVFLAGRAAKVRGAAWAALAFAFAPMVFVNSVAAKDYLWAMAFVWAAVWCAVEKRALLAGVLIGLATGCRITSLAMVLPVGILLARFGWRRVAAFCAVALATALICFAPVIARYGTGFFTFYENAEKPGWQYLHRATVEVWGWLGLAALAFAVVEWILRRKRDASRDADENRAFDAAMNVTGFIYIAAFIRLPHEAAYLIPLVPAVLLLLARRVPPAIVRCACVVVCISPWVDFGAGGLRPGAILVDHTSRVRTVQSITNFLGFAEQLPEKGVVVVGSWEPQIAMLAPETRQRYAYLLTPEEAAELVNLRVPIYYVSPEIRSFSIRVHKLDLAAIGGINLSTLRAQPQIRRESDLPPHLPVENPQPTP